jgi:hypothetical protein
VDQTAELVEAARRARRMNSTVWIVKRSGAIHDTMTKKMVSLQVPWMEHPNEGVAAERAIAATVWKQMTNTRVEISTRTELAL